MVWKKNPHSLWSAVRIFDVLYQAEELLEHLQEYENNFKYCFQWLLHKSVGIWMTASKDTGK